MNTTQQAIAADIYARLVAHRLLTVDPLLPGLALAAQKKGTEHPLVALELAVAPGDMLTMFERALKNDLGPYVTFARLAAEIFVNEGGCGSTESKTQ